MVSTVRIPEKWVGWNYCEFLSLLNKKALQWHIKTGNSLARKEYQLTI